MSYPDIVDKVSQETGIPSEVVDAAYKSFWKFIKQTIQALPLKEDLSEEEFAKLRTCFNVPSLGKLTCTFDRMVRMKERFNYIKNLKENASN